MPTPTQPGPAQAWRFTVELIDGRTETVVRRARTERSAEEMVLRPRNRIRVLDAQPLGPEEYARATGRRPR